MTTLKKPFQLLEINIISAQDLETVSKKMKTYAVAWVHQKRKLTSHVDTEGNRNPNYNDKFVFRVDEEFLREDTSAVTIQIYAVHWFRDTLVGTVRILVGNLFPPSERPYNRQRQHYGGTRFVALQVRRPSGRPQGILNIGVAILDSSMRNMPLYRQLSASAVGYRDLMEDSNLHNKDDEDRDNNIQVSTFRPMLRRTRSERSELIDWDNYSAANSSIVAIPKKIRTRGNGGSILGASEAGEVFIKSKSKKGKASSVISGAELREKPKQRGKKGKASSMVSDSVMSKETSAFLKLEKLNMKVRGQENVKKKLVPTNGKPALKTKGQENCGKFVIGAPFEAHQTISDFELGPPPSEVAAMMAERRYPLDDNKSSVLDGWSVDESVEGLKSKLERWRMELPPVYDRGFSMSSYQSRSRSSDQTSRRQSDRSSNGLFSCFGIVCGYECQCACGKPPEKSTPSTRLRTPAITPARAFI